MKVISRNDLATLNDVAIDGVVHDLGVVKFLTENPDLAKFIPASSNLAISWVRLEAGEELAVHKHPAEKSLILICEGSGQIMGDVEQDVSAGDMILVPSESWHGFRGVGHGFWGLSIQFNGKALYEDPADPKAVFRDNG